MIARDLHALLVAAVVGIVSLPARGQPPATTAQFVERIQHEFPPVWKKATDNPFISDCSFEQFRMTGGEHRVQALTFKGRHGEEGRFIWSHELTAFDDPGAKPFDSRVAGMNPRYEFKLRKPFGRTAWLLLGWRLAGENRPDYRPPVSYTPEIYATFSHLASGGLPLDKLVSDANWKAVSIQASPADPAQVRVVFTFMQSTQPNFTMQYSGWFDLDPKAGWCIRRSDTRARLSAMGKITTKNTICDNQYNIINGSVPVLTYMQCDDADVKPDGSLSNSQRRIFRFDTRYPDMVPDVEFTMSAFGLPEPVGMTQERSTPRYIWLLIATFGFAAVTVLFRWLARRSRPAPATTR